MGEALAIIFLNEEAGSAEALYHCCEIATPHGALPTGIDFTTVRLGTSMTETSLLLPQERAAGRPGGPGSYGPIPRR